MAETVAIKIEVDGGKSVSELQGLEKEVDNVKDSFVELEEAQESQSKNLQENLQGSKNEVEEFTKSNQTLGESSKAVASGMTNGYTAFLGVSALVGTDQEALIKTFIKLQSVTQTYNAVMKFSNDLKKDSAFLTGLNNTKTKIATGLQKAYNFSVGAGSKAMKIFRLALISTGIGALVVLIGVIISKWDDWKDTIMKFINSALSPVMWLLEKLGIIDDETERIRKKNHEAHMKRLEKEKSELESQAEVRDKRLNHEIALAQARGENSEKIEEKLLQHQIDSNKAILLKQEDKYREMLKNTQKYSVEELKEQSKLNEKLRGEIQVHERNLKVFNTKAETEKRRQRQKNWEERKRQKQKEFEEELQMLRDKMQKELDMEEEMQDLIIDNMKDKDAQKLARIKLQHERELAALRDKYGMETELEIELLKKQATQLDEAKKKIAEDNYEKLRKAREEEDQFAEEDRGVKIEKFKDYQLSELEILKARFDAGLITEEKYNEGVAKLEKEKEDLRKAGFAAASSIFNSLATLTEGNEKAQKGFLAVQKAITLAQIGVDTAKAISSLTANSQANPSNSVTFGAAGAIQFATGLAQILSNVAQAKKLLSGGSGVSAPSVPSAPSFNNNIPTTVTSGTAPTGNNTGNGRTEIPTTKVVLVESELQAMQSRRMQVDTIATI